METNDVLIRLITIGRMFVFFGLGSVGYGLFAWGEMRMPELPNEVLKFVVLISMFVIGIVWFLIERKTLWKPLHKE